jgi:hypothetical protein
MKFLLILFLTVLVLGFDCGGGSKVAPVSPIKTPTPKTTPIATTEPQEPGIEPTQVPAVEPTPIETPVFVAGRTPLGITLKGQPVPEDIQAEMDNALTELFTTARARGYSAYTNHSNYVIIVKDDCANRNGTMAWLDRLDSYDGTPYDQNPAPGIGEIYRAEEVRLNSGPPTFLICRDVKEHMRNFTRYGAEHIIYWFNDRAAYNATSTPTHVHPIM